MNTVQLVGRLTRDVDLRQTSSGVSVGTFTLAVNRNFTNQQGEREADFISCVIWRRQAEVLAQYTSKGAQIAVVGRLQTRNYENQQGQRVYVTEVVVDSFDFLETRTQSEQRMNQYNNNYSNDFNQPFANQSQGESNLSSQDSSPYANYGFTGDISEDDLPF